MQVDERRVLLGKWQPCVRRLRRQQRPGAARHYLSLMCMRHIANAIYPSLALSAENNVIVNATLLNVRSLRVFSWASERTEITCGN